MELFVDFSLVGLAEQFTVRVRPSQRRELSVGQVVSAVGDGVDAMSCRVLAVDGPCVTLRREQPLRTQISRSFLEQLRCNEFDPRLLAQLDVPGRVDEES